MYHGPTHWRFSKRRAIRGGDRYDSSLAQRVVNSRSQEVTILEYEDRGGDRVVNSVEQPLYAVHWSAVPPGSLLASIATRTCELGRRSVLVFRRAPWVAELSEAQTTNAGCRARRR